MGKFVVQVFGKEGCPKCKVLNRRIDKILGREEWADFEKVYYDITTVEGLVAFGKAECLNAQRIPSFLVCIKDESGEVHKIPERFEEGYDEETGRYRVPTYVGLETDYSRGGVITPDDIERVFREARASSGVEIS